MSKVTICWSCGVPTEVGQRFCNACGVALANTSLPDTPVAGAQAVPPVQDDLPTDEVPVIDPFSTAGFAGGAFTGDELRVVEQMTPTMEQIGLLVADATPPQGTPLPDDYDEFEPAEQADVSLAVSVRVRLLVVALAALTAVAVGIGVIANVISLDSTGAVPAQLTLTADGFTSNALVGGLLAAALLLGGAVLTAQGSRFGLGLVGGTGLAVCGLALWLVGHTLMFVDSAKHVVAARGGTYRLHLLVDVGFFALAVAAGLGALCGLAGLLGARDPGARKVHPALGAIGALASLTVGVGALLPVHSGTLAANFSTGAAIGGGAFRQGWLAVVYGAFYQPVPVITVLARLVGIVLLLVAGVYGFLSATRWGFGLALGALSVAVWQWLTSAFELGDLPFGIAGGNPGSTGHPPHVVVTVGVVGFVIAAVAQALWTWRQPRSSRAAT